MIVGYVRSNDHNDIERQLNLLSENSNYIITDFLHPKSDKNDYAFLYKRINELECGTAIQVVNIRSVVGNVKELCKLLKVLRIKKLRLYAVSEFFVSATEFNKKIEDVICAASDFISSLESNENLASDDERILKIRNALDKVDSWFKGK